MGNCTPVTAGPSAVRSPLNCASWGRPSYIGFEAVSRACAARSVTKRKGPAEVDPFQAARGDAHCDLRIAAAHGIAETSRDQDRVVPVVQRIERDAVGARGQAGKDRAAPARAALLGVRIDSILHG